MFNFGKLCATRSVLQIMDENSVFYNFVMKCLARYFSGDWGDLTAEDIESNNQAFNTNDTRIMGSYDCPINEDWKIWIITEYDRSVTTILFPHEY